MIETVYVVARHFEWVRENNREDNPIYAPREIHRVFYTFKLAQEYVEGLIEQREQENLVLLNAYESMGQWYWVDKNYTKHIEYSISYLYVWDTMPIYLIDEKLRWDVERGYRISPVDIGEVFTTTVISCSRCGGTHEVTFKKFSRNPVECDLKLYTHWGTCPHTGEPVLVEVH